MPRKWSSWRTQVRNGAVRFMTRMSADLLTTAHGGDGHFITSDRACLISPIARPEGKVLMALTRDVLLQLSRSEESRGDVVDADAADTLNTQAFRAATRFVAGPSCGYLRSLWEERRSGTKGSPTVAQGRPARL